MYQTSLCFAQDISASALNLKKAIALVRSGDVATALQVVAGRAELEDLVKWFALKGGRPFGTFSEIRCFLEQHADWPEQDLLRNVLENSLTAETVFSSEDFTWLRKHPPRGGRVALAYAIQARQHLSSNDIKNIVRSLWERALFSREEEAAFFLSFRTLLRPEDTLARVDHLLWNRQTTAAERLFPLLPEVQKPLFRGRIDLLKNDPKKTSCPEALVKKFGNDLGFAYAVIWLEHKKDKVQHAPALLKALNFTKDTQRTQLWWTEAQYVARDLFRARRYRDAYQILVKGAAFPEKSDAFIEAQILAGWVALRRLKNARAALEHFCKTENAPGFRYRARALYWKAQALQSLKRKREAKEDLKKCASLGCTFWGQVARAELKMPTQILSVVTPSAKLSQNAGAQKMIRLAHILAEAGEVQSAQQFLNSAAKYVKNQKDALHFLAQARRISPYTGVQTYIAHVGAHILAPHELAYPTLPLEKILGAPPVVGEPLAFGVIRAESGFHETILSCDIGRGYMQLMPLTAKKLAEKYNWPDPSQKKLSEGPYNILLGTTLLRENLERYQGCYPMAIAAYNAGCAAVDRWIKNNGDPRIGQVNILDWIEMIPYRITRIYVQTVLTDMHLYGHLLRTKGFDLATTLRKP